MSNQDELSETPLLHEQVPVPSSDEETKKQQDKQTIPHRNTWRIVIIFVVVCIVLFVCLHVISVVHLQNIKLDLHQLTIPDLCHSTSQGEVILELDNPSSCTPDIGEITVFVSKNNTSLLQLVLPAFTLFSGKSTLVSDIDFTALATPSIVHDLVFIQEGGFTVDGNVAIHISCLLIPFTVTLNLRHLTNKATSSLNFQNSDNYEYGDDVIKTELHRLVAQILKTIALSKIQTEDDADTLFAFTDVSFDYQSRVLWNIPSLTLSLQTNVHEPILLAGFKPFLLGNGETFISSYTEIYKNETRPLQKMLMMYLSGSDVHLHVQGHNIDNDCLSLKVLDLVDVPLQIPATIDGKPALLRGYSVIPTLKELDSDTHKCRLELDVLFTLNNPLPIRLDLFSLDFDLFYHDPSHTIAQTLVTHIDNEHHIVWGAHEAHNVSFSSMITRYEICSDLIHLFLRNQLYFSLSNGHIHMAAENQNVTIPFQVPDIPIHPTQMSNYSEYIDVSF